MMTASTDVPNEPKPIDPQRVHPREQRWAEFLVNVPAGMPLEAILSPGFWLPVQHVLTQAADILCVWDDRSRRVQLTVLSMDLNGPVLHVLADHELPPVAAFQADGHRIEWRGGMDRFAVVHVATGNVVRAGFGSIESAALFMRDDLKLKRAA